MVQTGTEAHAQDIVVTGQKGRLDTQPLRHFDAQDLRALGITSIQDLMQRLGAEAKGPDGSNPVFAINGRRPLDDDEVETLPFDALLSFDVLPQVAAARLGYSPNQPVMNLVTKPKFQGFEAMVNGQASTDGGGGARDGRLAMTRLRGKSRLTLSATVLDQSELRQSRRSIRPDPDQIFDSTGNITGLDGGEIDPRFSMLAGETVTIAAVPLDPGERNILNAYLSGANRPNVSDLGAYRSLQPVKRSMKISGFLSQPISDDITGALSLSVEQERSRSLQGLAAASILVPADNSYAPFATDILLNRYLVEVGPLEQRGNMLSLHAAAGLTGTLSGWNWSLRLNHDRKRSRIASELGFDLSEVQAAVLSGSDPFSIISAQGPDPSVTDRSRSVQNTTDAQLILNGIIGSLPAGPVSLTATLSAQRSSSDSASAMFPDADAHIGRSEGGGAVTAAIPIASAADNVLPFLGRLSAELSGGLTAISRYAALKNAHASLIWTPAKRVQLLATLRHAQTAPKLDLLGAPRTATPNTPFVDLVSGESLLVTSIAGGNSDLLAERRRTLTFTANFRPLPTEALRTSIIYEEAAIRDQSASLSILTPAIAAAYQDRFVRDETGQLTTVDLRPVNLHREKHRTVKATVTYSGQIGAKPEKPPEGELQKMTYLHASVTPAWKLEDRLVLAPGAPPLDLLGGDSISASGGRPRWDVQADLGLSRNGLGMYLQSVWHSGSRVRSPIAEADLRFASLGTTGLIIYADMEQLYPKAGWAKKLMIDLNVKNITNARPQVRDRSGETPISQQAAYLDPLGRAISLRLFKRF
ncbi:hypothetical protein JQK15_20010 [Sphingobium sp. BHU LFT2]|uniref:hypothetical protein n=1 Tax=Sphingobium sp. BHU LFT2 TaxID=2807634 RepID=UPI001BECB6F7|nr:hypothetical protein [Sphingobium sp. BHU LFT2]MBT2245802.1 hypothetical protein [Sphingobium sp. BHU LFT2]